MTSGKRVDTLICHTTMRKNAINFLYNPGHVTLWCLEVVPVVYARVILWRWVMNHNGKGTYVHGRLAEQQWKKKSTVPIASPHWHPDGAKRACIQSCLYWLSTLLRALLYYNQACLNRQWRLHFMTKIRHQMASWGRFMELWGDEERDAWKYRRPYNVDCHSHTSKLYQDVTVD